MEASKTRQHLTLDLPRAAANSVWVHACSVGEVASVAPLVKRLLTHGHSVHLTVVTRTGFHHARRLFGEKISLSWLPWDLPLLMRRFIRHLRPRLLILCETEFWPGMLKACKRGHIPIIGVNTRISDRSFPKYRQTRWLWQRWLDAVHLFLAQSDIDAERLHAIGVPQARIKAVGNLKFAVQAPDVDATQVRRHIDPGGQRPILIIASTHDDEEAQIMPHLRTWQQLCPTLLTLIVPRHPERFDAVATLLTRHGITYTRYTGQRLGHEEVVLVDAMGVLTQLYTIADLVFIGGSLVNIGGHNPLEAAICGRGVLSGQHVQNFREIFQDMQRQGAAIIVQDHRELRAAISRLLQKPDELKRLHGQAVLFMQSRRQVLDRVWQAILPYLNPTD